MSAPRTCLLLFDFLAGHVDKDRSRYAPVIANAAKLLAAARVAGAMVAHARADHRADRATHAPIVTDEKKRHARSLPAPRPRAHDRTGARDTALKGCKQS